MYGRDAPADAGSRETIDESTRVVVDEPTGGFVSLGAGTLAEGAAGVKLGAATFGAATADVAVGGAAAAEGVPMLGGSLPPSTDDGGSAHHFFISSRYESIANVASSIEVHARSASSLSRRSPGVFIRCATCGPCCTCSGEPTSRRLGKAYRARNLDFTRAK